MGGIVKREDKKDELRSGQPGCDCKSEGRLMRVV